MATTPADAARISNYEDVIKQARRFFSKYPVDIVGKMATVCSLLKMTFPADKFFFVGFYTCCPDGKTLQVGPYQGDVLACGLIDFGKGVCGTAASEAATQIVPDVSALENYIACDDETQSEIVVPVFQPSADGTSRSLFAVLDIDSTVKNAFDDIDASHLARLCETMFEPPAGK